MTRLLNSKNYAMYEVELRDTVRPVYLDPDRGRRLMEYLSSGQVETKHVKLTDRDGAEQLVLITDIRRVTPIAERGGKEKYV